MKKESTTLSIINRFLSSEKILRSIPDSLFTDLAKSVKSESGILLSIFSLDKNLLMIDKVVLSFFMTYILNELIQSHPA